MRRLTGARGSAACSALLAVLTTPAPLSAEAPPATGEKSPALSIGDPAPPVRVAKWVKGPPVPELEKGKVYVVDVWSTWCVPCLAAMPHATELQKRFREKGLVVVGVTAVDSFGNS